MAILVDRAILAARRGELEELEVCLAKLRQAAPTTARELEDKLRGIARCVRSHPAYRGAQSQRAAS
ncbi:MAG TPA: hypothetical protein VNE62_01980 [Actinomycetota bacterium]|nr:hypothetical protein [Actinomycetota bacterium]